MSRKRWLGYSSILVIIIFVATGLIIANGIPKPLFPQDYSKLVLDANGEILRVFLNKNEQWILPEDGSEIPFTLRTAVIQFEDKRFEKHWGIDFLALGRAIYQNITRGSRISGASTLTMQVARLMQPKPRTIKNKIIEMFQAIALEVWYTKDEILKLYLLHAPYGSNIIGYRTAALRYFGQEPENLSWSQAATLAVLPNNPGHVNPMQNQDKLQEKRDELLKSLYQAKLIDQITYELAIAEPVPQGQYPFNLSAPHIAERLARNSTENIIITTIEKEIQDMTTNLVKEHITTLKEKGVRNGAVLVTDTSTGEIKAYVGSQDYFDDLNLGKIDGVRMLRSTGSTLKPFLYGLAMDAGLIVPESVLPDVPVNYGGYTPYNISHSFAGVVRADQALIRSLNAPAVHLLNNYGIDEFHQFFATLRLTGLTKRAQDYGLSMVLGSIETSLLELSRLYQGLANYGAFLEQLSVVRTKHKAKGVGPSVNKHQLITKGSAYLVLDVLKEVERPGGDYYWREYQSSVPIAWKTGTSYGNRDAWAIGVSPRWVIAVWIGNFSGGEIPGLSGIDSAAPLLFKLFAQLEKGANHPWFDLPEAELKEIFVSQKTGYRLNESTLETKVVLASAGAAPLRYSPYEKQFFMNLAEDMQVCSLCWDREDMKTVSKLVYPSYISLHLANSGLEYNLPPHNPNCPGIRELNPLDFIYPTEDSHIFVPRDIAGGYQKVVMEVGHAEKDSHIFWYLDQTYLTETVGSHRVTVDLDTGWHQLYIVDAVGNSNSISFFSERK